MSANQELWLLVNKVFFVGQPKKFWLANRQKFRGPQITFVCWPTKNCSPTRPSLRWPTQNYCWPNKLAKQIVPAGQQNFSLGQQKILVGQPKIFFVGQIFFFVGQQPKFSGQQFSFVSQLQIFVGQPTNFLLANTKVFWLGNNKFLGWPTKKFSWLANNIYFWDDMFLKAEWSRFFFL